MPSASSSILNASVVLTVARYSDPEPSILKMDSPIARLTGMICSPPSAWDADSPLKLETDGWRL